MKTAAVKTLTFSAAVAALYAVLTLGASAFGIGITFGPIQCRVSEALCVLPFLLPSTAWGLFAGCLIANFLSPYGALDLVLGSLATLTAGLITSKLRNKWLAPLPAVILNGVIVGALIAYSEVGFSAGFRTAFAINGGGVAAGELIACYVLGMPLLLALGRISYIRGLIPEARLGQLRRGAADPREA